MEYNIETKVDSYGDLLYRVKPPTNKGIVLGWFASEQEAIDAFNTYANN